MLQYILLKKHKEMNFPKNHLFQEDKNIYSLISGQGRG